MVVDLYHDDDVTIWVNGHRMLTVCEANFNWQPFEMPASRFANAVKKGENVFCVEVRDQGGCSYFDCGLVVECGGVIASHAGPDGMRKVKTDVGTWTIVVQDGVAQIGDGSRNTVALDPPPKGHLKIPSELDGLAIRKLGLDCFIRCDELESVEISEGICSIGEGAFFGCRKLSSVSIPASLRHIGFKAFLGTNLTRFDLENVRVIESEAFVECDRLETITASQDNVAFRVKDGVLYDRIRRAVVFCPRSRASYDFPTGIEEVCDGAFRGGRIKHVVIPKSVWYVGHLAFADCPFLKSVTFKGDDAIIRSWAFGNTPSLKSVVLPSRLRWLDDWSIFQGAGQLESIKLPDTVEVIDDAVFAYCPKLKNIYLGKSLRYVDIRAFAWCPQLQEISFPATLKVLRAEAFVGSSSLQRVTFAGNAPELQDNDDIFGRDIYKGTSKTLVTVVPKGSTGWLDGSANLPQVWPVDGGESARQIRHDR